VTTNEKKLGWVEHTVFVGEEGKEERRGIGSSIEGVVLVTPHF